MLKNVGVWGLGSEQEPSTGGLRSEIGFGVWGLRWGLAFEIGSGIQGLVLGSEIGSRV